MAVLSLLLCVSIGGLWVRSRRCLDYVSVAPAWRQFVCMTFPGGLKISTWPDPVQPDGVQFASYEYGVRNAYGGWVDPPAVSWSKLGFDVRPLQFSNQDKPARDAVDLFVPFWFLAAMFLVLPVWRMVSLVRIRRRTRTHRCLKCGYDLRATPDRCPECGTATGVE